MSLGGNHVALHWRHRLIASATRSPSRRIHSPPTLPVVLCDVSILVPLLAASVFRSTAFTEGGPPLEAVFGVAQHPHISCSSRMDSVRGTSPERWASVVRLLIV